MKCKHCNIKIIHIANNIYHGINEIVFPQYRKNRDTQHEPKMKTLTYREMQDQVFEEALKKAFKEYPQDQKLAAFEAAHEAAYEWSLEFPEREYNAKEHI